VERKNSSRLTLQGTRVGRENSTVVYATLQGARVERENSIRLTIQGPIVTGKTVVGKLPYTRC
jgi:hypothetical protein